MEAINIDHLTKIYPDGKKALQDLNIIVQKGEIFTLLGQNGAGKSTLINILTTYLTPTSGKVNLLGFDLARQAAKIREHIACVAQKITIDHHLSLVENLMFQARLYRLDAKEASARINEMVNAFGLEEYTDRRVATYSGGIKRRLDIAMSMVSHPGILFLDEPSLGLDVEARQTVWHIIRKIRNNFGTTIFMTTHYLEEADALSDTICILKEGHELAQDTPDNLRKHMRQNLVKIELNSPDCTQTLAGMLSDQPFVMNIHSQNNSLTATVKDRERDMLSINRLLLEHAIPYRSIGLIEPHLENVYLSLVRNQK